MPSGLKIFPKKFFKYFLGNIAPTVYRLESFFDNDKL